MKKTLKITISIIVVLLIALIGFSFYLKSTSTNYNFEISSDKVDSKVKIIFDDNAVPHIYAETEKDAMFALGYVHASERLWQMDLIRHVGAGQLSELFGKDMIENDKFLRTIGIDKTARISAKEFLINAPENIKTSTQAYLSGINKFIEEDNLPIEYKLLQLKPEYFEIEDIYRTTGYMAYSFALALKTDPFVSYLKQNFNPEYLDDLSIHTIKNNTTIPVTNSDFTDIAKTVASLDEKLPVPQFIGSNAWVIAPKKTKSGKVIFANDAHIAFASPSVWYEAHIITPELEYYGNHLAGFPFPLIGHTLEHSWGLTMFENDDIDLYQEKINDGKYLQDSIWYDLSVRKEKINIKDSESIELEIKETKHGAIINDVLASVKDSEPVAMWWTYNKYSKNEIIEAAYNFSRADDIDGVKKAASMLHAPGLNIMYGDSTGNIAWWASAKLPIRPDYIDSKEIIDGTDSKNDITGWYDFSKNPQAVNPESGYVYSANNAPAKVDEVHYPGYYYHGNTRAKGIIDALESQKNSWTIEDAQNIQLNGNSPTYKSNFDKMFFYLNEDALNEKQLEMLDNIKEWKGTHTTTEIAPTIYYKWMYNSLEMIFIDELGEEKFKTFLSTIIWERSFPMILENENSPWWNNIQTDNIQSASEIITSAFIKSYQDLNAQLGNDISQWKWGEVHQVTFKHPIGKMKPLDKIFNIGPFPVASGKDALNKLGFPLNSTGVYNVTSGPSERITLDFSDIKNSESIIPTGQSGNPFSDYYSNQTEKYLNGEYRKQRMDKDDIEANKSAEAVINVSMN
ncbi:MAG: penicillin acylase family protein [Bacteroidota bacterium]